MTADTRVERYRDAADAVDNDDARYVAAAVIEELQDDLKEVTGEPLRQEEVCSDAVEVLTTILNEADTPSDVVQFFENKLPGLAKHTQTSSDRLDALLVSPLRDAVTDSTDPADVQVSQADLRLQNGIALDTFVEKRLKRVEHRSSTDHIADVELAFVFDDGDDGEVTMIVNETEHLYRASFRAAVGGAVAAPVRDEIVSERIAEDIEAELPGEVLDDDSVAADAYAEQSHGPATRPWHDQNWDECMTDLVDEHRVTAKKPKKPQGPRTDAWEYIQDTIKHGQVTSSLTDALDHSVPYFDEDTDEVWVPVTVADQAVENYSCSRVELYYELVARGVGSDEIGGDKLAEPKSAGGIGERVYRLNVEHDEVPTPVDVVEHINAGGADALFGDDVDAGVSDGSYGRATDGGQDVVNNNDDETGDADGA
jgi:hypothetical protein